MMPSALADPRQLARRALAENGFMRRSRFGWEGIAGHKEWLHFALHVEGLDLLVNLSVVDDVRHGARAGMEQSRIVCLVREQSWMGDIDHFAREDVRVVGGQLDVRFAHNYAVLRHGKLELSVRMRELPVALRLSLDPATLPTQANNLQVEGCDPINWIVVPRLHAHGEVHIEDRRYQIAGATAYHDHNWGRFRWGKNFAWEWGYAAPDHPENPWTLVFVRLSDRPHLEDLMQAIFVWKGERQVRLFRAGELRVRHEGLLRPERVFKLPQVMRLACPSNVTDVPKRLVVRAERGRDHIDLEFIPADVAQVIIPNDDDLGVTIINEVAGMVAVSGRIDGERMLIEGSSIFEFLGDG